MAFTINRLELPDPIRSSPVDFRPLSQIGDVIAEGRRKQRIAEALGGATDPSGKIDVERAGTALASIGEDPRPFLALAQQKAALGETVRMHEATIENMRESRNLQRQALEEGKVPPGFMRDPNVPGGLVARPGFVEAQSALTEARAKPRQFNVSDITKLTEEGQKFGRVGTFADTFDPKYAGYGSSTIGNMALGAGRYLPESVVGKDTAEAAGWWQDYDRYKNVIRHDLYGSALTAQEQATFERADINPGMTPEIIKRNLSVQKSVIQNGLKRKANAMISAGYDPAPIAAAYGVDLRDIGVAAKGRQGSITPRPLPTNTETEGIKVTNQAEANQALEAARRAGQRAIAAGGDPAATLAEVNRRLQSIGAPPLSGF